MNPDVLMGFRVPLDKATEFKDKCRTVLGRSNQSVLAEMVTAFNEGRLKITPTTEQKETHSKLYD